MTRAEARVSVLPAPEVFVKVGSPVLLTCNVLGCPAPVLPMWYKGSKVRSYSYHVHEGSKLITLSCHMHEESKVCALSVQPT